MAGFDRNENDDSGMADGGMSGGTQGGEQADQNWEERSSGMGNQSDYTSGDESLGGGGMTSGGSSGSGGSTSSTGSAGTGQEDQGQGA
jgi:hypothetical protein